MKKVKVLQYVPSWLPQTETWLYNQVKFLPSHIENHVVCEKAENLDQFPIENLRSLSNVSRVECYWDKGLRKLRLRNHLGLLSRSIRKLDADIVHSHFGNVGWANYRAVKRLGVHHLVTFYGLDVNHLPVTDVRWKVRYRRLFASVDRVLCEGPHMAYCIEQLGCPSAKVRVHHLGVQVSRIAFRPRRWLRDAPLRVLIAGTFREKKGIPYALSALSAIRSDVQLHITIIGEATAEPRSQAEKRRILTTLKEGGLAAQTKLLGFCSHDRLMAEAATHDLFLSPSVTAEDGDTEGGAPVTIIEMSASGMPVISTRHCDIPNVLPQTWPLSDERDIEGLVRQLRWWLDNAFNWEPHLLNARRRIERSFDCSTQGTRLAEIYAELLERSSEPSSRRAMAAL